MKKSVKRKVAGFVCMLLCLTTNINPLAIICGAIVDSGITDRLVNLKNNLIYIAENGSLYAYGDTNLPTIVTEVVEVTTVECNCNPEDTIKKLMGTESIDGTNGITMKQLNDNIDTVLDEIKAAQKSIGDTGKSNLATMVDNVNKDTTHTKDKVDEIDTEVDTINNKIGDTGDSTLVGIIGGVSDKIGETDNSSLVDRIGETGDSSLVDRIDSVNDNVDAEADSIRKEINTESTNIQNKLETESSEIQGKLDAESTEIQNKLDAESTEIQEAINNNGENIQNAIIALDENVAAEFTVLQGKTDTIISEMGSVNQKLENISEQLSDVTSGLSQMQHNYRVAHMFSLNNTYENCLWRPYSEDIPYVKDIATVTGRFANVYTGYWDTKVNTLNNPGNQKTVRAQEILGYDAIIRSEGMVLTMDVKNVSTLSPTTGLSGSNQVYAASDGTDATHTIAMYFQEIIPEKDITWIDAVTLLYKALGQEQVSYQSFMSSDRGITPETSPAYQGLSNPVPDEDGNYAGYDYYMFLTRSNMISNALCRSGKTQEQIVETLENGANAKINYIYWEKAINGGFIPGNKLTSAREPITFSEFFKLAAKMMQAYGEPVMNDDELKSLLQVYGTHYPVQLGTDVADAWAYMAARGILDFNEYVEGEKALLYDFKYTGYITRDQLLTMCMRIADEDSRTDYKKIDIVLNLSDVMREDYYYPVYDLQLSNGEFAVSDTYDHTIASNYDYLIAKTEKVNLGTVGTPIVCSDTSGDAGTKIEGAYVDGDIVKLSDKTEWYHVSVPKSYNGNIYITMYTEGDAKSTGGVDFIRISSKSLGGGIYSKYTFNDNDKDENNTNVSNKDKDNPKYKIATVAYDATSSYCTFDEKSEYQTRTFTDYKRAKEEKPVATTVGSNATILEWLAFKVDELTTPVEVYAEGTTGGSESGGETSDPTSADITYYNDEVEIMGGWESLSIVYPGGDTEVNGDATVSETLSVNNINTILKGYDLKYAVPDIGTNVLYTVLQIGTPPKLGASINYATSQDKLLMYRLSTITKFSSYIPGRGQKDTSAYSYKIYPQHSVKGSLLKYIKEDGVKGYGNLWSDLYSLELKNSDNKINMYNSSKCDILSKYEAFPCQFLLGISPWANATLMGDGSGSLRIEFNLSAYGVRNKDFNKFLVDNYDKLFTEDQDKIITDLYKSGLSGVTKGDNNRSYTVTGRESSIDMLKETLASSSLQFAGTEELGGTTDGISIDTTVASSTVMNRNQQILISWADMCASGYIVNTGSYAQPTMRDNGAYYFMTHEGQVIVNDVQHTIQIGNTLYDLYNPSGDTPRLVYIDTEQENTMYFDYRCIMGVVSSMYSINDGKTETFQNHLGVGNCVIYDLQSNGVTSDWYNTVSVRCYNYPEVGSCSGSPVTNNRGYDVNLIKSTVYDDHELPNGGKYWRDEDGNSLGVTRLRMSTFVPTANYMCYIHDTEEGSIGELFVYYLRTAFEDGYYDVDGLHRSVPEPNGVTERYGSVSDKVSRAEAFYQSNVSLSQLLNSTYGYEVGDETAPWYIKMTYDAIADLYGYTGKYYFSEDHVIRRFDMSEQSISNCIKWNYANENCNVQSISSNEPGAIYWIDSIGYIYNMPTTNEFTLTKYLTGEYLLPLAYNNSSTNPSIINYNLNYYGFSVEVEDDGSGGKTVTEGGGWLPYGVVLNTDGESPYVDIRGNKYQGEVDEVKSYNADGEPEYEDKKYDTNVTFNKIPGNGDVEKTSEDSRVLLPFNVGSSEDKNYGSPEDASKVFTPAPSGIYNKFGGNLLETLNVSEITRYVTDAAKVYYGSSQVKLDSSVPQSSDKLFQFVSTEYNSITLPGSAIAYRVYRSTTGDVLVIAPSNIQEEAGAGVSRVEIDDYFTNPLEDWLNGLGSMTLLNKIDTGASILIIFAFQVLPIIGVILMTILVGLSFVADIKVVQILCDKTIDPIRILTFGARDIHTWHWRKVLFPCILLFTAFALFMDGNIIRIIMWGAEWYGTIIKWFKRL